VNRDLATVFLHAFADAHPLTPRGVQEALERVKVVPAASGSAGLPVVRSVDSGPGAGGWAGYLVARELDPDGVTSGWSGATVRVKMVCEAIELPRTSNRSVGHAS